LRDSFGVGKADVVEVVDIVALAIGSGIVNSIYDDEAAGLKS